MRKKRDNIILMALARRTRQRYGQSPWLAARQKLNAIQRLLCAGVIILLRESFS